VFRKLHPAKREFTFSSDYHKMAARLDRCYISDTMSAFIDSSKHIYLPSVLSDHDAGISFTVRVINAAHRGPGFWKLNVSLLKRPGCKKIVQNLIKDFVSARSAYSDTKSWWESLKYALHLHLEPMQKAKLAEEDTL
jgi:hypothetical protein